LRAYEAQTILMIDEDHLPLSAQRAEASRSLID